MGEQNQEDITAIQLERLSEALDAGKQQQVKSLIENLSGAEIGDLLESLPPTKRLAAWELTDPALDGEILVEVGDEVRAGLIRGMTQAQLVNAVGDLDLDDLADILEDLPEAVINEVLRSMDRLDRERLETVLSYPEDSAGGLLNPHVMTIRRDVSLEVVLRDLRSRSDLRDDMLDQIYVVDRAGNYRGLLKIKDLLTHDPTVKVAEVMDTSRTPIKVDESSSQVAMQFERLDLVSAPVVDANGRLLGRITIDDVVDVIREEHNLLTQAGLDEDDDMFAPVIQSARRRWIWLGVNLITALLAAFVLYAFEPTLDQIVATAVLFPVVMSMGGIAGTQTLTLMIRGMATGQVGGGNASWMMRKELAVGLLNGVVFSIIMAVIAFYWYADIGLGMVMAAAILINLIAGAFAGAIIPVILKRLSIDPALAGGVVLTTVTDVIGILAFIGLASWVLLAT